MMTEEEAKAMPCVQALISCRPEHAWKCIASGCPAWRWQPTHINNPDDPKGDVIWSARTYGFCGLAGDSPPLPAGAPR